MTRFFVELSTILFYKAHPLPSPLGDSPVRGNVRKDKRVCGSAEGKGDRLRWMRCFNPRPVRGISRSQNISRRKAYRVRRTYRARQGISLCYIVTNNLAFRKDILHCACAPFRMTEQRQLLPLCHFERNEVKSKNPKKGSKAKTFFIAPALHSE